MTQPDLEKPRRRAGESGAQGARGSVTTDAEAFLRGILMAAPAYLVRADADLRIRFANRVPPELEGDAVVGRSLFDFIDAGSRPGLERCVRDAIVSGTTCSYDALLTLAPGRTLAFECHVAPSRDEDGRMGVTIAALDVTAHRRRARELEESRRRLRVAIEATGIALWSWELPEQTPEWSERMYALTGSPVALTNAAYIERIVHPDDREWVAREMNESIETGHLTAAPHRIVRPDGSIRWVQPVGTFFRDANGVPVKVVGGMLDVTEQRALEDQLRHAQKMEAIGELAAGVAHNFNNMLAAILPVLEMIRPYVPYSRRDMVDQALHAGGRAAEMVHELLAFARTGRNQPHKALPIEQPVRRAAAICERLFDRRIALTLSSSAAGALVYCDPGQIEQALINVLLNARDAIVAAKIERGAISVDLSVLAPADLAVVSANLPSRAYVCIRVTDNGEGMSEEVRRRVFEPFFTTKEPGRGTGLGLATTFAIVREHGGIVTCSSEPGRGAVFELFLPIAEQPETPEPAHAPEAPRQGTGQTVMVVDDEDGVREVTALVLEEAGYRVLRADSARQALELAREEPNVALVLLDPSMPKRGGFDIVDELRSSLPRARIACFTGEPPTAEDCGRVDDVLLKPFVFGELLRRVQALLER